jgi:putative membrane protein
MAMTPSVHQHGIASWAGRRLRHDLLNWRLFLVRVLTSGLAVVVTVVLLPGLRFDQWGWGEFVLIGLVFGLLNAVLKPLIQFFALRYLIASYGLVVVLINALLLALLSWILGGEIQGRGVLAYLIGGLLVGVIGLLLDTIAGATPPILDRDVPSVAPAPAMMAAESAPRNSGLALETVEPMVIAQAAAVLSGAVDAVEPVDAQLPPVPREDDAPEEMPS